MAIDLDDVFKKINSAPLASRKNQSADSRFLKFETNQTYLVRVLPYMPNLPNTFVNLVRYSWNDAKGGYHSVLSPSSFGGYCPIMQYRNEYRKNHSEAESKALDEKLQFRKSWLFNVYVVNDPVNPENNGTVKIVKASKQLWNVVDEAWTGKLDEKWTALARRFSGANTGVISVARKMIDLTNNGVNLAIRVGENNIGKKVIPDYRNSEFTYDDAELNLTESQQEEILKSTYDLVSLEEQLTPDAITELFNRTFLQMRQDSSSQDVFDDDDDDSFSSVAPGAGRVPSAGSQMSKAQEMQNLLDDADDDDDDNIPF